MSLDQEMPFEKCLSPRMLFKLFSVQLFFIGGGVWLEMDNLMQRTETWKEIKPCLVRKLVKKVKQVRKEILGKFEQQLHYRSGHRIQVSLNSNNMQDADDLALFVPNIECVKLIL